MDKETLYELRSLAALHPYYQTVWMLLLRNLYLLHDSTFDKELRKAAVYITDRTTIFNLIEAQYYQLRPKPAPAETRAEDDDAPRQQRPSRTLSLIDDFLDALPEEDKPHREKRKPTTADAAIDYVAYLLEMEDADEEPAQDSPQMNGQDLIDSFINNENGKIQLKDQPEYTPEPEPAPSAQKDNEQSYFTETLARIYISQGKYEKALEIIRQLNLTNPKKNVYFADQIRFLEKLILNGAR